MKKNYIKPETIKKLQTVANRLYDKYGKDVTNLSNFRTLIVEESERTPEQMSYNTIAKYQNYLAKIITNIRVKEVIQEMEAKEVVEVSKDTKSKKIVDYIIVVYKDGSIERRDKKEEVVVEENPVCFIGLFNYLDDKIIVRRGTKTGCNVKSIKSILNHFNSIADFQYWCESRLKDVEDKRITPNADTPRDVETLKSILNKLKLRTSDAL